MNRDKLAHVFAGIAIAAMLHPFGEAAAVSGYCIAALVKEGVWDRLLRKGTPELADLAATVGGGTMYVAWMRFLA